MTRTLLLELQATHDYLTTIARDLTTFPPDLAELDGTRKSLSKRLNEAIKAKAEFEVMRGKLQKDLELALRLEEHARRALKAVTQKVQYAAAMREVDERERARNLVAKPLKETEARLAVLEIEIAQTTKDLQAAKLKFEEIHTIFLAEHETQVSSRSELESKRAVLESQMPGPDLAHFLKLLSKRAGKAVAPIENGSCSGCHTKLRNPYITIVREAKLPVPCENCQRFVYMP